MSPDIFYIRLFRWSSFVIYILYIFAFFQLNINSPKYIQTLQKIIQAFVAIMLILIFNPIKPFFNKNYEFNREIAFYSGIFMLTSSILYNYFFKDIVDDVKDKVDDVSDKVAPIVKQTIPNKISNKQL